jgi:hypothetical protein
MENENYIKIIRTKEFVEFSLHGESEILFGLLVACMSENRHFAELLKDAVNQYNINERAKLN